MPKLALTSDWPSLKGTSIASTSTSGVKFPGFKERRSSTRSAPACSAETSKEIVDRVPRLSGTSIAQALSRQTQALFGERAESLREELAVAVARALRSAGSSIDLPGRNCPSRWSRSWNSRSLSPDARSAGRQPSSSQSAAARPTAWPPAAQVAITRVDPKAT